ncbi:MAG: hypothetical protein WD648_07475, partial [Planctomycetaceae bacterium]
MKPKFAKTALCGLLVIAAAGVSKARDNELYAPPSFDDVKSRTFEWVAARKVSDQAVMTNIASL